ncbi:MAG: hypothetical protein ACOCSO_01625 [Thermoplasmatota archaeon]
MDWMDGLEEELSSRRRGGSGREAEISKAFVEICLYLLARFLLNTPAHFRMHPDQWDMARYHGGMRWELLPEFDFSRVGEIMLTDEDPRGAALFADFFTRHGSKRFRVGFILPDRVGEDRVCRYFLVHEDQLDRLDLDEMWRRLKPGLAKWYESLLREEMGPLRSHCEGQYQEERCPQLPGNV